MIKNIIFDFGDVFINLDKEIIYREIERFGGKPTLSPEILALNSEYEVGAISSETFVSQLTKVYPTATSEDIIGIWNGMILDFPDYRLKFLEDLSKESDYRLFLLSNTNDLHISHIIEAMGTETYERFKNCFEQFYLSHEINLRKPNANIYEYVLQQNNLNADETFFIDDTKENTDAAEKLGITCWNLKVGEDDIIHLKTKL